MGWLGFGDAPERGEGYAACVVDPRRGRAEQLLVLGEFEVEDVLPPAEADQHVRQCGAVTLDQVGQWRTGYLEQLGRDDLIQAVRCAQGFAGFSGHHGALGATRPIPPNTA
ncbi:hypothetical protein [Streptomyces sp. NPDC005969]|uniref:hypothetical protein n=1 Tax=Streptomyces sp. NPDC005969 TaxID=3156722 RepID=UPI0033CBEC16